MFQQKKNTTKQMSINYVKRGKMQKKMFVNEKNGISNLGTFWMVSYKLF